MLILRYIVTLVLCCTAGVASARPFLAGGGLGLYSSDPSYDYAHEVDAIAASGANAIGLHLVWFVESLASTRVVRVPGRTCPDAVVTSVIERAQALGLDVVLVPMVLVHEPEPDEWRGALHPWNPTEWFQSYTEMILHYARMAAAHDVHALSIGSELSSLDGEVEPWHRVIESARSVYQGRLTYAANWDRFELIPFWNALDFASISAYFALAEHSEPAVDELVRAWLPIRERIRAFRTRTGRDVVFIEIGYASQDGTSTAPWDYTLNPERLDHAEQVDCFRAFSMVWAREPALGGAFVYDWLDAGGLEDPGYSPRGKPALAEVESFYRMGRSAPP